MSNKYQEYMKTPTESLTITPKITSQSVDVVEKATAAINPIYEEISTSAGMDATLVTANEGKMYKYTGTTDTNYTNGRLYVVILAPTTKSFADCTWAEIKEQCDAGYASQLITDGIWNIGDINTNATYGSYSGVRLVHVLTDAQRGSSYYGTDGHIIVEFVNTITTSEWHSSCSTQTSYSAATILTTLNSIYSSGLNSDFKSVLKSFAPSTSVQSSSSSGSATTSVEHPLGYLHVPNCVEVGSTNSYRPSENDYSFCFTYYSDSLTAQTRRKKNGASPLWGLRSPSNYISNFYYRVYGIYDNGAVYDYYTHDTFGVAPIAVI